MNDTTIDALYLAAVLILPIGALAARRLPLDKTVKMALAWVGIFGVLFVLMALWQEAIGPVGS